MQRSTLLPLACCLAAACHDPTPSTPTPGASEAVARATLTAGGRLEAEAMTLTGLVKETDAAFSGGFASGGAFVRTASLGSSGNAAAVFDGPSGSYALFVGYYDETDGVSSFSLSVDGAQIAAWKADGALGDTRPSAKTLVRKALGTRALQTGALLRLTARSASGEWGRLDYLDLLPLAPLDGAAPPPATDASRADASRVDAKPAPAPAPDSGTTPPAPPPPVTPAPSCPGGGSSGAAPNGTTAGAITVPHPTLANLSVEWAVSGDANTNGVVEVRYRKAGDPLWRKGMPLRRVPAGSAEGFSWGNRHSGSLFDLEPGTSYEVELYLHDPDGGCQVKTVTAQTRPLPVPMPGAPVKPATPSSFASLAAAAAPGDILELAAGSYSGFTFGRDGQAGKPIVIRGTAGAVVNGSVILTGRKHVHLTGLTINGLVRIDGTQLVAVMRCTVKTSSDGINAYKRAEDSYLADNVVTGATAWAASSLGVDGNNLGEGIRVTGPGHVIAYNRVTGFRDNLSFFEDGEAVEQYSIDVIGNDVQAAADDGIEADFCFHNCRVLRNRFTNVFVAMSSQPGLGGPTYFIRNVVYSGVYVAAFKLHRGSVGDVALHNTIVKNGDALAIESGDAHHRQYFRNNLFLGGPGGTYNSWSSGSGKVVNLPYAATDASFDYDGFGSTTGAFSGKLGSASFASLAELRSKTTEQHAVQLALNVFASAVTYPASPFPALPVADLRLKAGSAAVDVGLVIPNVNDGYAGAAPDLGAYELGAPLPVYGPR